MRRNYTALVWILLGSPAAWAQPWTLREESRAGTCYQVQIHMSLKGEMKVRQGNESRTLPQEVQADHEFYERVLDVDADGLVRRAVRWYRTARARITTAGKASQRTLRPERTLIVAQCYQEQPLIYSPKGALSPAELDLMQHFDTLHLAGLLPRQPVAIGDSWSLPAATVQALCAFEGLTSHNLRARLEEVQSDQVLIHLSGTASGIDLGAAVQMHINAQARFDRKKQCLVSLEWQERDERDQGPASPTLAAEVVVRVTRTPCAAVAELNDLAVQALVPAETTPPAALTALWHRDPQGRFELTYARGWQLVAQTERFLVLRLLDRGEFVAQATVSWWEQAPAGQKHLSAEAFQKAMAQAPGWEQEKLLAAKEMPAPPGYWIYRLEALGRQDGVGTLRYCYLVAGPEGQQMVVTFALTPSQVQTLGNRDLELVQGLTFTRPASAPPAP